MMLIIGLGNPGVNYEKTRHNAGFIALDSIAESLKSDFKESGKYKAQISICEFEAGQIKKKIILLKPQTYMNLSGISASLVKSFYKINIDDVVVLHDDIDLKLGQIKHKQGGGSGGHNGIRSLDENIGSNYHRIRIGVGRPDSAGPDVASFVLNNFTQDEMIKINEAIGRIANSKSLIFEKKFTLLLGAVK
ncbi:MAG: aminoacyl-tRNA hydrolase [Rickettsiaceae bacterium]|nr:aminoacyl-tRNA hydrolase [Rickettsiaceae bacterium]